MSLSKNSIYQGDCIERLGQLEPGSVDLVFADPPFNIGYDYDVYDDRRQTDDYLDWCRKWIGGVWKSLKPDGTFWLAIGDEYAAELKLLAQDTGFSCRSWVIWYYTFGVNCVRGFSRSHTHLFHFVRDSENFTFNAANPQVRVKSARQLVYADHRANPRGRLPDNTWIIRPQDAPQSFRTDHDTWYFARVAGTFRERQGFHGCQMPEQLLGRIIRVSSNPQDLVVDPFGGSGTTMAVAKKLGRQWLGFELSDEYVQYINHRLAGSNVGDPLDGPDEPLLSAPNTSRGKRRKSITNDPALDRGVIDAWSHVSHGQSADHLLCDPELNQQFVSACKQQGVPGNETVWNKSVLRLRKSKRLPRSTARNQRLTFAEMDDYSFASEIAMRLLSVDFGLTLDNILCSPEYAAEFDRIASEFAPGFSPREYRWGALAIRKRSGTEKSRRLATDKYGQWLRERLPRRIPLDRGAKEKYEQAGVYVLKTGFNELYIGETENVARRMAQILENPAWQELEPTTVSIIPLESSDRYGLQSALVQRLDPILNSRLLRQPQRRVPKRPLVAK